MNHTFCPRSRSALRALSVLLLPCALALPAAAQQGPAPAAPGSAPLATAAAALSPAALHDALNLGAASLQTLELPAALVPGQSLHVRVTLAGMDSDLVLVPHSLRADDFQLLVQGADGVIRAQQPAAPVTYRGHIEGLPESVIAAALLDGQLHAVVRLDPTRSLWGIQPATLADPGAPRALHVVYDSADAQLPDAVCGTPDVHLPPSAGSFSAADPGDKVCEIACDADFEFYTKNGSSVTNAMNDVELVLNAVEAIYDNDVGVLYDITTILVRTSEPDPYTSTNSGTLLNQFSMTWNANQTGVHRDIAHLFTGKEIDGNIIGLAQLNVICSQGNGYGLSQSKYTGNLAFRAALTAHELGHNWSANHCDGESGCSIMCSGIGGCSGNITSFSASSKTAITNKKNSSGCLGDAVPPPPPVLATVSPASVQALLGGTVTLTGSGFLKASDVLVGGVSVAANSGFAVQSDAQLTFGAPSPTALGPASVVVVNVSGSSGAKTLTYVETSPPKLLAFPITVSGQSYSWLWGAGAGDTAFLLVAFSPATFLYQGQPILATNLILSSAPLDAAGFGSLELVLPASAGGLSFFSEVVTLDGPTVQASNIATTIVTF